MYTSFHHQNKKHLYNYTPGIGNYDAIILQIGFDTTYMCHDHYFMLWPSSLGMQSYPIIIDHQSYTFNFNLDCIKACTY